MKYLANVAGEELRLEINRDGQITLDGRPLDADLRSSLDPTLYSLVVGGRSYDLRIEPAEGCYRVQIDGETFEVVIEDERTHRLAGIRAAGASASREFILKAPMPGIVIDVPAREGEAVAAGSTLVVVESMKMHNEFKSPRDGTVHAVRVAAGDKVNQGQILVTVS